MPESSDFLAEARTELDRLDGTLVPVFVEVIDEPPDHWEQPLRVRFWRTRPELRWERADA